MHYRHTNTMCLCVFFAVLAMILTKNDVFCVLFHEFKLYNVSGKKVLFFGGNKWIFLNL